MVNFDILGQIRCMQYAAALSATLSMTCFALYMFWSSPTLPRLTSSDSPIGATLSSTEASWVASAFLLAYIPGGMVSTFLLSKISPKSILLLSAIPLFLPWFVIIFAKSAWELCLARFIGGIGSAIASSAAPMYTAEVADKDIRGKLVSAIAILYYVGGVFVLSVGPFVSYTTLAISCSVIPLLFFVTFWFMPDSPYYLVKINKTNEARANLISLSRKHVGKDVVQSRLNEITEAVVHDLKNKSTLKELLTNREYCKPLVIMAGARVFQQLSGAAAIESYMQTIIAASKSSISPEHSSIIFGVIQIFAALIGSTLVDKMGRKPLIIISALGCALALVAEGIYFCLNNNSQHSVVNSLSWLPTTGLVIFLIMFSVGLSPVPNILTSEIFPTNVRGHAVSLSTLLLGITSVFVVIVFNPISKSVGIHYTFFMFAILCILGVIFIYFVLPETKGKSFVEIQTSFNKTQTA